MDEETDNRWSMWDLDQKLDQPMDEEGARLKNVYTQKQRFCVNVSQIMDPNHASILKSTTASHLSGQVLHGTAGGLSPQMQARGQKLPAPAHVVVFSSHLPCIALSTLYSTMVKDTGERQILIL